MNNIDFIKMCCRYVGGFKYKETTNGIMINDLAGYAQFGFEKNSKFIGHKYMYNDFLQCVMAGINHSNTGFAIEQKESVVQAYGTSSSGAKLDALSIVTNEYTQAKRVAIEYVLEQIQ